VHPVRFPRPAGVLPRFDRAAAALQFCLGVGKVIFNRQPVTPVAAGVCE